MLEIRTLGGFSMGKNGVPYQGLGSRKAEAILVYLVVQGRPLNRNVLKTLFWPESSEERASVSLRVELSLLNSVLGEYLDVGRESISLIESEGVYLDRADLLNSIANHQIEQALELYQGEFLAGFHVRGSSAFDSWVQWEQDFLQKLISDAIHTAIDVAFETENYSRGLVLARRLLEMDPLDELGCQKVMLLLVLDGQRSAALGQYDKWCTLLWEELEALPAAETQALYEKILRGEKPEKPAKPRPVHNLPAHQTSFVGREEEIVQINNLIQEKGCRLLTLVGPGGSGKTRLALESAARMLQNFMDGTYFVSLEGCSAFDYLVPTLANVLQFNIESFTTNISPKIQLFDYLRDRSMLLILDGFEHLVENSTFISELLYFAPHIKVMVTSRQKLTLKGEWVFPVDGLGTEPSPSSSSWGASEAFRLFLDRTRQVQPMFQPDTGDNEYITCICKLVEGMPLGVELAAAWMVALSLEEIYSEVKKSLSFLSTTASDVPPKHRSLQAAFESSWKLLDENQRQNLSKLSVFKGGFDRQAAEWVCGVNLEELCDLLGKSLLRRNQAGLFSLHSLIQEFAAEKLNHLPGLQDELQERHCRYFTGRLEQLELDLWGRRLIEARDEIRRMIENTRAAISHACYYWDSQAARNALSTLLSFYIVDGWHEGKDFFGEIARLRRDKLIAEGVKDHTADPVYLSARTHQAFILVNLGQQEESQQISSKDLPSLKDLNLEAELSECMHNLGACAHLGGEQKIARQYLEEAIQLGDGCGYILTPAYMLWQGHVYFLIGEYEQGMISLRKCYERFDRLGCLWGIAFALTKIGLAYDGLKEHSQGMSYHHEAFSIFERIGNQAGKGYSLSRMSMSAFFLEDYNLAIKYAQDGYQLFKTISHYWGICTCLVRQGFAYLGLDDPRMAGDYFKESLLLSRERNLLPMSLYSLAGEASLLSREGFENEAHRLYNYIRRHPECPTPYLEQAQRWLAVLDQVPLRETGASQEMPSVDAPISVMLEWALDLI